MSDYGVLVAKEDYDVRQSSDLALAFSSSFQNLKIFERYSVSTTVPSSGVNTITITHDIGFYSPFIVYNNGSGNNLSAFMGDLTNGSLQTGTMFDRCRQYTDKLEIDIVNGFGGYANGTTVYLTVYIMYDNFSTINEETVTEDSGGITYKQDDYGLRVSKEGYDVRDCTDDQLIFSSQFFTKKINQKGIITGTSLKIKHALYKAPSFLAFVKNGDHILMIESNESTWKNVGFDCYIDGYDQDYEYDPEDAPDYANGALFLDEVAGEWIFDGEDIVWNFWHISNTYYYIIFKDEL